MDTEALKTHYLRIYRKADEILKQPDNPCQIEFNDDGKATCVVSRRKGYSGFAAGTLCCNGCQHHDPKKGCTVESLSCKLGWCYINANAINGMGFNDHPTFKAINDLRKEAVKLGIPLWGRNSFEQSFPTITKLVTRQ